MKTRIILLAFMSIFFSTGRSQHLVIVAKDSVTKDALPGVSIIFPYNKTGGMTDRRGRFHSVKMMEGKYDVTAIYIGYKEKKIIIEIPFDTLVTILMAPEQNTMEEITVTATRTNARMKDTPLKVEVLGSEETGEENAIKPGNIASLLGDISGIQIQQSSATSGNTSVRIQGLAGKYTQIMRDGLPLYEGFSGSFGIMQVPPLDLKQIEIIKGSASTLYGAGAIGGTINLVSKEPGEKTEGLVTTNISTLTERNFNGYCSVKKNKRGATIFSGVTYQNPVDVNGDGFSDVPKIQNLVIHPRLFFYMDSKTTLAFGFSSMYETRRGGDMQVLNNNPDSLHQFFEEDKTDRNTGDFIFTHTTARKNLLAVKGSFSMFDKNFLSNKYRFDGTQTNGYGEISYLIPRTKNDFVAGLNFWQTSFEKNTKDSALISYFNYQTFGAFAQNTYKPTEKLFLEAGIRTDYHSRYGLFMLPRISSLYKLNDAWYTRAGAGLGYVTPNPFAEQNIEYDLRKVVPIADSVEVEKSIGANLEVNYKKRIGNNAFLYINHAFFYTQVNKPVITATDSITGVTAFSNADGPVTSAGSDTYVRFKVHELEIYFGYTYTMARQAYNKEQPYITLTPRNRAATVISYEIEGKWRFGMEGAYSGFQYRDNGTKTPDYFFMAAMIEKKFQYASIVLNCEDLLDARQTKHEAILIPPTNNPSFKPLWGPIDGRVINLSLVLRF